MVAMKQVPKRQDPSHVSPLGESLSRSGLRRRKGGSSVAQTVLQKMEWLTSFLEEEQKGSYRNSQDPEG